MELSIRPATDAERKYSYTQSSQITGQTGCIGHLRQDFGSGSEFHTTWDDHYPKLNTEDFKKEFGEVIKALRKKGGMLASRSEMSKYCHAHPESGADGELSTDFFFRVDTQDYAYMFRLNPQPGYYSCYCYAYTRQWFDRHISQAEKGIRFADGRYNDIFRLRDGDKVRVAYPDGTHDDTVCRYVDEYHLEYGRNIYHIHELAERIAENGCNVIPLRSDLPDECYSILDSTGEVVRIKKGEDGYFKTDTRFADSAEAQRTADKKNEALGVTKAQEQAMKAGSMFGWACPAADPKNYDGNGTPIKPKHRSTGAR